MEATVKRVIFNILVLSRRRRGVRTHHRHGQKVLRARGGEGEGRLLVNKWHAKGRAVAPAGHQVQVQQNAEGRDSLDCWTGNLPLIDLMIMLYALHYPAKWRVFGCVNSLPWPEGARALDHAT